MMILKTSRSNLSSNDQLALDLPFAATKSLTARVGPTPTFSRASGATYIGSDGLIHGIDTSTTSNTIGTGSRTFTLAATAGQDQLWRAGDVVEASNGSNFMTGTVTSYDAATQSLVCNMTSTGGSGTFTSWRIGYRGPRFDHTAAGVCRGLLIEESRTNLLLRSEDFGFTTYWTNVRSTTTINVETSPDGATTSEKIIADTTASSNHSVDRPTVTLALNTVYTFSIFAKAAEYTGLALGIGISATEGVRFSLVGAGTATSVLAGNTGTIQQLSNGWYRCTCTFTSDSATAIHRAAIYIGQNGTTTSYTGDGTSGIFIWGAQLELGSFATSYIPTTTTSVVRSADVCSISGANFTSFYNSTEGTSYTAFSRIANSGDQRTLTYTNGTSGNRLEIFRSSSLNRENIAVYSSGSFAFETNLGTNIAAGSIVKIANAMRSNDWAASINGAAAVTNSTTSIMLADRLVIGSAFSGALGFLNGHIASIRYYRKRLPNAKLQSLTA